MLKFVIMLILLGNCRSWSHRPQPHGSFPIYRVFLCIFNIKSTQFKASSECQGRHLRTIYYMFCHLQSSQGNICVYVHLTRNWMKSSERVRDKTLTMPDGSRIIIAASSSCSRKSNINYARETSWSPNALRRCAHMIFVRLCQCDLRQQLLVDWHDSMGICH